MNGRGEKIYNNADNGNKINGKDRSHGHHHLLQENIKIC